MRTPASLIRSSAAATPAPTSSSPSSTSAMVSVDPDMVVILASLLCALICVAGLALVGRCACRRRAHLAPPSTTAGTSSRSRLPRRGLKKKAIDALPVTAAASGQGEEGREDQCAICLADFAAGEQLRVLPQCGHAFHVACVDTWLGAHATCPSCRAAILDSSSSSSSPPLAVPGRCRRCGATCVDDDDAPAAAASDESGFLP